MLALASSTIGQQGARMAMLAGREVEDQQEPRADVPLYVCVATLQVCVEVH